MGAWKGPGNCWEGGAWGIPSGMERSRVWNAKSGPFPLLSPCFVVPPSRFVLQARPQKHKVKTRCQIQADRTSASKGTVSLWATPCLPNPPLGPLSGLSLQGGAIQIWEQGSCWHHPHTPGWGAGLGQGVIR